MGLLSQGKPLSWEETNKYSRYVQEKGIKQFINLYNASKDRADGPFKWGDEVEYMIIKFDHERRKAKVCLKSEQIFRKLEELQQTKINKPTFSWNYEFGAYMLESTPGTPYGCDGLLLTGLCEIESNMKLRRQEAQCFLDPDSESVMTITSFPRLGAPDFTFPPTQVHPKTAATRSLFLPDDSIFGGHPRFKTLGGNIAARRGKKVEIYCPIYKDINTPRPFIEETTDEETRKLIKPDQIFMDSIGFGMGCCCLQITLQATHMEEAKVLYDQLLPFAPIGLALSAASPVYRGYLSDRDCRWSVVSSSVDDRTSDEKGENATGKKPKFIIPKSRYDSASSYLSKMGQKYNDPPLVYDKTFYSLLVQHQVDHPVAQHIAHLFIRQPVTLYREKLEQSDHDTDHFENIQSTNWQTVRFKPPPSAQSPIGWRVEFRPLEVQTTDFENAAFVVFITLLSRVILAYKLNFLIPIALVDENMVESQKRDAITNSKFWFRRDIMRKSNCCKGPLSTGLENLNNKLTNQISRNASPHQQTLGPRAETPSQEDNVENYASRMTSDEIINGCDGFVGLMPIVRHYVESFDDGSNSEIIAQINKYLAFISNRASSKTKTTAKFIREFIQSHPSYARDSRVGDDINYDLLCTLDKIGKGQLECPELTGCTSSSANFASVLNMTSSPSFSPSPPNGTTTTISSKIVSGR